MAEKVEQKNKQPINEAEEKPFLKKSFFKISQSERKEFWILGSMFSLITIVYTISSDLKDTYVISRQIAISINFLKLTYIPIISTILSFFTQYFVMKYNTAKVLGVCLIIFSIYFLLSGCVYGKWDDIEPEKQFIEDLVADGKVVYKGCEYLLPLLYTTYSYMSTIVYILTEVWSSTVLSVLFFSYLFECCTEDQNIRFFPVLSFFPGFIRIVYFIINIIGINKLDKCSYRTNINAGKGYFFFLSFCSLLAMILLYFNEQETRVNKTDKKIKKKEKVSLKSAIKIMITSRVALSMCLISAIFCILLNLTEQCYKSNLEINSTLKNVIKKNYVLKRQAILQGTIGFISVFVLLLPISRWVYTKSWFSITIISPFFCGISAFLVFTFATINTGISTTAFPFISKCVKKFINVKDEDTYLAFLTAEEITGIFSVAFFKAMRYTLFDIAKEAIGIKISPIYRSMFKCVYDNVIYRLGKAIGSGMSSLILIYTGGKDIRVAAPAFIVLIIILIFIWITSIFYLNRKYEEAKNSNTFIDIDLIK